MNSSAPTSTPPSSSSTPPSAAISAASDCASGKKVRKPYTISKSRESWTEEEHDKFLEALQLFDRDWKKIEDFVASKTVIQIRSHAQKYFLKVQKSGTLAHVPPPRPKRKASHPYPQKAPKNGLLLMPTSMGYSSSLNSLPPGYPIWDDGSFHMNTSPNGLISQDDQCQSHNGPEDVGSRGYARISNCAVSTIDSPGTKLQATELPKREKAYILHGIPDFAEVYSFIGGVFDPETRGHVQKLKEMDPINFETVLLLMRNLTMNLTSPDFDPIKEVLSGYDISTKTVMPSAMTVVETVNTDLLIAK